jgi:signal transduction histidine kinase/CheY-like chemotaxis protein
MDLEPPVHIQLRERVKELQCLYRVADLSQRRDCTVVAYLQALPDLLPPGWYYPEICAARVEYRGQQYQTDNYRPSPWNLTASLLVGQRRLGSLELVYLEERPALDEGPFLAEERALINALATHVTKTLQNKDMEERVRRAQRLEALGFVAGGVAHDFNNFLSLISLSTEQALIKVDAGESVGTELKEIVATVQRSCRLVNRLVSFAGCRRADPVALAINDVLTECRGMLSRLVSHRVELRMDLEPELHAVRLDPTQLDQLLANLTVNARDAMPDGGVLELQTRNVSEGKVMLAVQDGGIGMSAQTVAHIFDPFYSTKGAGGGGLGLATVEDIMLGAGGEIHVESSLGEGTRFELLFPALPAPEPARPPEAPASGPEAPASGPEAPRRLEAPALHATILLAEDEPALRYLCERLLRSAGYSVLSAETGEEALRLARDFEGEIDLLLSDLMLTDTDGRLLSERLTGERPAMATLLMSGYSMDVLEETAAGYAFIQKPFDRASLRDKIQEVIGGSRRTH